MDKTIGWGNIAALNSMTLCIALLDGSSCAGVVTRWRRGPLIDRSAR
ncbi:hypothetical protein ACFWFS_01300 [Streptomyces albidoflavus]